MQNINDFSFQYLMKQKIDFSFQCEERTGFTSLFDSILIYADPDLNLTSDQETEIRNFLTGPCIFLYEGKVNSGLNPDQHKYRIATVDRFDSFEKYIEENGEDDDLYYSFEKKKVIERQTKFEEKAGIFATEEQRSYFLLIERYHPSIAETEVETEGEFLAMVRSADLTNLSNSEPLQFLVKFSELLLTSVEKEFKIVTSYLLRVLEDTQFVCPFHFLSWNAEDLIDHDIEWSTVEFFEGHSHRDIDYPSDMEDLEFFQDHDDKDLLIALSSWHGTTYYEEAEFEQLLITHIGNMGELDRMIAKLICWDNVPGNMKKDMDREAFLWECTACPSLLNLEICKKYLERHGYQFIYTTEISEFGFKKKNYYMIEG